MALHFASDDGIAPINSTVVAIDKDKNSHYAVRWTIDHLLINNPQIILIHVRHKYLQHQGYNAGEGGGESETDAQQVFIAYRGYCARKAIQLKEIVLDDVDVSRAIIDYITRNRIKNIVVGASTKNALTRKFRNYDVSTSITKSAPDFCSVYVISKGKVVSVRSAQRPVVNTAVPPKLPSPRGLPPQALPDNPELEDVARIQSLKGWRNVGSERVAFERTNNNMRVPRARSAPTNLSIDNIDLQRPSTSRDSVSDDLDFSTPIRFASVDLSSQDMDFSITSDSGRDSLTPTSAKELAAEMKRLKLELKQTMDMYSTACKEAITAKQKAKELHQWRMEEARRFKEARLSEEAALAMAEMEKARCKAAIEAAEVAQKLAEKEAQRRRYAELKASREAEEKARALTALAHNDVRYRKYAIEEIEVATEKFSQAMKIGEGGYGPVYRGKLDHTPVAIKVLRPDAAQGMRQFQQEIEVLSCMRHPNMVLLLGACPEYGCLVYEYMSNGSLEDRLLRRGDTPSIPWRMRFKIAAEIATALLFLHQAKPEPFVHRDLKPANILLDRNYVSKISDVGLARLVPPSVADSVTQYHMTSAAGTFCYIDPEYQQTGMLGTKSDVYSMGIMLLQIITAKPPMGLTHHVRRAIEKGTFADMLDQTVPDWPVEEALAFANLALKCSELRKKDRPDLGSVVLPELNRLSGFGMDSSGPDNSSNMFNGYVSYTHRSGSHPRLSSTASQD